MQYISNGFQTAMVNKHGIKSNEIKFLDWFDQFLSSGKMFSVKSRVDGKQYFFIDYAYVMDSLPAIRWNESFKAATQMLKRILDGLVEKKIIERLVIQTQTGKKVFIRFVDGIQEELKSKENQEPAKKSFKEKRAANRKGSEYIEDISFSSQSTKMSIGSPSKIKETEPSEKSMAYEILSKPNTIPQVNHPDATDDEIELVKSSVKKELESQEFSKGMKMFSENSVKEISKDLGTLIYNNDLKGKEHEYIKWCSDKVRERASKKHIANISGYLRTTLMSSFSFDEFKNRNSTLTKAVTPLKCMSISEYNDSSIFS